MQINFFERNRTSAAGSALCGIALALIAVATPATAGIFNVPSEPADWNGPYIGFNAGVTWDHYDVGDYHTRVNLGEQFQEVIAMLPSDANKPLLDGPQQINLFGFTSFLGTGHSDTDVAPIGGMHFGYNKQFGHFVAGFEFGFEGTQTSKGSESRSSQVNFSNFLDEPVGIAADTRFDSSRRAERNWDGWVGGQLGYAWGRFLFYATGGYTFTDVTVFGFDRAKTGFFESIGATDLPIGGFIGGVSNRAFSNASDIMNGWFAGGGAQFALNNKVSIGLEYRHSDFGDETYRFNPMHPIFPGATNVDLSSDQVQFKVNVLLGHLGL